MKHISLFRFLLPSMLLAASVAAAPAFAQISFNISIGPPLPQYEMVPVIAPGYVWAPGYWGWNGDHHVWVRGRAIIQRAGYRWEPDRWEQRGGSYYRQGGRWERDAGYKVVAVKKEKNARHRDNDRGDRGDRDNGERGHGNSGKHGKGG